MVKTCNYFSEIMGAFHSTKNSEIFETETNGTEISWEGFQKIRKLLNFRKANHSTEKSGNSKMKIKWNRNFPDFFFEHLGIFREVVPFYRKLGKSAIFYSARVLLATITVIIPCKDDGDAYSKMD